MSTIIRGPPILKGKDLVDLVDKLRSKLEYDKARLLAKGRNLNVRVSEYINAQRGKDVQGSIRWVLGDRNWRYVSFTEFIECLKKVVNMLHTELYGNEENEHVCFVVDSFNKSSFWVIMMSMLMRKFAGASLAIDDLGVIRRRSMNYDVEDSLLVAFRTLPDDTRLVMMDDATYSGEQLSYFHDVVVSQWRASRSGSGSGKNNQASVVVAVPFMSRPSKKLFKRKGTVMILGEAFPGLFDRRSASQVVAEDLYLEVNRPSRRESPLDKYGNQNHHNKLCVSYTSLFFDVIGLLPTNTMFVFEHKIGDSLSIPNRWLKVGQCPPPNVTVAYRVKKDRAVELVEMIRKDLVEEGLLLTSKKSNAGPWTPSYRLMILATSRIRELLSTSREFQKEYFDRVDVPPTLEDGSKQVAFLPLISPEFCDAPYRRYVRLHRVERGKLGLVLPNAGDDMPPCRRPPYKRTSFRRRIVLA